KLVLYLALVLGESLPIMAQSKFVYSTNADSATITITEFTGSSGTIIIPDKINGLRVAGIGSWFRPHTATNVIIPDSVLSIGEAAFSAVDTPGNNLAEVTIGNGVISIGRGAFEFCEKLTGIRIPKNVTSIGSGAFGGCFGLKSIIVDSNNAAYSSLDGVLFNKDQTELVQYPPGKAGSYTIPNTVRNIADYALWNCPGLTSVTIPEGITEIKQEAFAGCYSLTNVIIPASVTNIGPNAFNSCVSMRGIYFWGNAPDYGEPWRGGIAKVLGGLDTGTIYYRQGTTGWGTTFGGRPTALWEP
ncbi:MAG: leucine-rich repeat domain-containing protein, partial [Limisphaerales bacterium]